VTSPTQPCGPVVADAALLLVHGIGRQRRGKTLCAWSRRLRKWLGVCALTVDVQERPGDQRSPAHQLWRVGPGTGPARDALHPLLVQGRPWPARTWLVAESHWRGATYPRPSGPRMAWWLVTVAPWIGLFHIGANYVVPAADLMRAGRVPGSRLRVLAGLARLSASLYLAFVTRLLGVVLFSVLALVLLAAWVVRLTAVVGFVTDFVGAALAASSDDAVRNAMCARIERDLAWCERQVGAGRVVVVAHSQGAMLTREVLAQRLTRVDRFVSLGSGLGPLHTLGYGSSPARALLSWLCYPLIAIWGTLLLASATLTTGPFLAGVASLGPAIQDSLREFSEATHGSAPSLRLPAEFGVARSAQDQAFGLIAVATVVGLIFVAAVRTAGMTRLIATWRPRLRLEPGRVGRWIDVSSPYDPVSCGPLLRGVADESFRTANSAIPGREHGGYLEHPLVLTMIVSRLAELSWGGAAVAPWTERHVRARMSPIEQRRLRALRTAAVCTALASFLVIASWLRYVTPWLDHLSRGLQAYL
jgi:pimeloyl-ACP methyl ester carboxylesterase